MVGTRAQVGAEPVQSRSNPTIAFTNTVSRKTEQYNSTQAILPLQRVPVLLGP